MTLSSACSAIGFLLLLIALLVFVRRGRGWAGRLRPPPARTRRLRLIESLTLDPRRRVLLIDCAGREITLLTGGTTDLVLTNLEPGFGTAFAEQLA